MGRLRGIPSTRLVAVPSRFAAAPYTTEAERSRVRRDTNSWRDWYTKADWRALRWTVLVEELFTCRMCGRVEDDTSQLVGDHIKPHRGDRALFLDRTNVQCLCKTCHDSKKQTEERKGGW